MSITDRIDRISHIPESHLAVKPPKPRSVKIELSGRCNYRCLRGDTLVDTIYGPISIKELAEKYTTVPVLTYKNGEVFIADAINIRKYGEGEKLVRVEFDDGTHIDCTPDHQFLEFHSLGAVPGTEEFATEAQWLHVGSRIRAFRENEVGGGYINICAGRNFHRKRFRLVMEHAIGRGLTKSEIVHHKDHNVTNDHPDNLECLVSAKEHAKRHPEIAARMRTENPTQNMTPEWRENISRSLVGKKRSLEQRLRYRESKLGAKNPRFVDGSSHHKSRIQEVNHKVVSVTALKERDDVYCLEVPETGWFFANKVLVKNCGFCALTVRAIQPKEDMNFELFKRITREMKDAGVEEIGVFFIGESFISPKLLVDAVTYLKQEVKMPYVFLTSNASMATPENVQKVMAAGLDSLKWSVNVADEEQFEEIIGVSKKLFLRARHNIQEAYRIRDEGGYDTKLYASSIRYDGEQQEKMEEMLREQIIPFVDQHYWLPLYSMGSLTIPKEEELGYFPSAGNIGRYDNPVDPLPCWSLFTEGHVLSDGRLSACCFDATGHWIMGDLKTESFMEAWHSEKFQELRQSHLNKDVRGTKCEDCALYSTQPTKREFLLETAE